ncbi:hypothetical protein BDV95DRAFT_557510 [Massariosphaeria phaeospora]|uniref:Uncharacterized protein n=1 Tax=Massariosphaeria phaeospora TaxID=100035 RepID=A0A7C8IFN4_9PLEO|nr:hypothetical protein BDV95DRAFT_557510 [Massariosphaeria phaeospora]
MENPQQPSGQLGYTGHPGSEDDSYYIKFLDLGTFTRHRDEVPEIFSPKCWEEAPFARQNELVWKNKVPFDLKVMKTSQDKPVIVYVPTAANKAKGGEERYFCHGWGLGTYDIQNKTGYSVSSTTCADVLADATYFQPVVEPNQSYIPANADIKKGDIVAWFRSWDHIPDQNVRIRSGEICCMHTAIIEEPVFGNEGGNKVLSFATVVSSKNGGEDLNRNMTLRQVDAHYQNTHNVYGVFRWAHEHEHMIGKNPPGQEALERSSLFFRGLKQLLKLV